MEKEINLKIDEKGYVHFNTDPPIETLSFDERVKFLGMMAIMSEKLMDNSEKLPDEIAIADRIYTSANPP